MFSAHIYICVYILYICLAFQHEHIHSKHLSPRHTHKGGNPGHPTPAMTVAFVGHHFCKEWMRLGCHAFLNMLGSVESRTMVNRRMYVFISTSISYDEEHSCIYLLFDIYKYK